MTDPETSVAALRTQARELQTAGRLREAIDAQLQAINSATGEPATERAEDLHRLAVMLFAAGDFSGAARFFGEANTLDPAHPAAVRNLGLSLIRIGRLEDAVAALHAAEAQEPDRLDLLDGLAEAHGKLGNGEIGRRYGERALLLRDEAAVRQSPFPNFRLPETPPPPFRPDGEKTNVIAFSLFGDNPRYLEGALRNTVVAHYLYPGWTCRFYCDASVPRETIRALRQAGAQVVAMPRPQRWSDALFWRFLVAEDPAVGRFLVRDCDSVMNYRERAAVAEWLESPCYFHAMRDYPSHTDLLLAGLWGGVAGVLPPLGELLQGFGYDPATQARTADQLFLGRRVWPLIRSSCLIHDRCYRTFGARPFPAGTELPAERHVGENDHAAGNGNWRTVVAGDEPDSDDLS